MQTLLGLADREAALHAALDLEKGIHDVGVLADPRKGCKRWPEHLWITNTRTGEMLPGACKSTNLCEYCRERFLKETTRMLALSALEKPPTVFAVLTAREFLKKNETMWRTMRQCLLAGRREWPELEWFLRWEEQARGALHVNVLAHGVPSAEAEAFRSVIGGIWCKRVDAELVGQYAEPCATSEGVVGYVMKKIRHAAKTNQEPHLRQKHRTSQTRGYLVRPARVMREEARRSLRLETMQWKGYTLEEAIALVDNPDEFKLVQDPSRKLSPVPA